MVYLRSILKDNRSKIIALNNIELAAYLYIHRGNASDFNFDLTPDEDLACKGYGGETVESRLVSTVLTRPGVKGLNAASNVYKLCGLYLASPDVVRAALELKYNQADLLQKFFIYKIEPLFGERLNKDVADNVTTNIGLLIKRALNEDAVVDDEKLNDAIRELLSDGDLDVQRQVLLEDIERALLRVTYVNESPEAVVRQVLKNFSNAVKKITSHRRKDHDAFRIADEYDVQDLLYVILKAFFPLLREEDPIPKVGAKSTKIDLLLRDQKILVEVKMIKEKDSNETEFIEQLKKDFESYHQCQWLSKLFCFVYDPFKKTRDLANFSDLNGNRVKGRHRFDVEVIVVD